MREDVVLHRFAVHPRHAPLTFPESAVTQGTHSNVLDFIPVTNHSLYDNTWSG